MWLSPLKVMAGSARGILDAGHVHYPRQNPWRLRHGREILKMKQLAAGKRSPRRPPPSSLTARTRTMSAPIAPHLTERSLAIAEARRALIHGEARAPVRIEP